MVPCVIFDGQPNSLHVVLFECGRRREPILLSVFDSPRIFTFGFVFGYGFNSCSVQIFRRKKKRKRFQISKM